MSLPPLKFRPRFVQKMWGGRRLETLLGKALPDEQPYGESWELYDFPPGAIKGESGWVSAAVAEGPLAGRTVHELIASQGEALLGEVQPLEGGQLPILIKFLDAEDDLSVQVHPKPEYARKHAEAHLKNECWHVMDARPGSRILKNVKPGVTPEDMKQALDAGNADELLQSIPVNVGDTSYLPSGTVHALGAGILAAEVQTPSDVTYRVFDFNRVDPSTGKTRELHVDKALENIVYTSDEPEGQVHEVVSDGVVRVVKAPQFTLDKVEVPEGHQRRLEPGAKCTIWMILDGEVELAGERTMTTARRGETLLLPADIEPTMLTARSASRWLKVSFP